MNINENDNGAEVSHLTCWHQQQHRQVWWDRWKNFDKKLMSQRGRTMPRVTEYFAEWSFEMASLSRAFCKFLLVSHCNYVYISYRFWDIHVIKVRSHHADPTPITSAFRSSHELSVPRTVFASSHRCTDLEHLLLHFLSSAFAWRHTSLNSVTRNHCWSREVTLSYTLIALTYLLK